MLAAAPELVADINDTTLGSLLFLSKPVEFDGLAYFTADDGISGPALWKSDGTEAGTSLVVDLFPQDDEYYPWFPQIVGVVGDELIFSVGFNAYGPSPPSPDLGLWKTDGTSAGTSRIHSVTLSTVPNHAATSDFQFHTVLGDELFFEGSEGDADFALWKTDGTSEGTTLVKNIKSGSRDEIWDLTVAGDHVYFVADDGTHGKELWKSDGTESGTVMVKDIEPGSTGGLRNVTGFYEPVTVPNLIEFNGEIYFSADDTAHGRELWKSDGTESGTQIVADIAPGSANGLARVYKFVPSYDSFYGLITGLGFPRLATAGGTLYFTANDTDQNVPELWKTDGTESGTVRVPGGPEFSSSYGVSELIEFQGDVFFTALSDPTGLQLWRSDGTADGTSTILTASSSLYSRLQVAGDDLYVFAIPPSVTETSTLWVTDGTSSGSEAILSDVSFSVEQNQRISAYLSLDLHATVGDQLFFGATDREDGYELWASDGTHSGTRRVKDIAATETYSSYPRELTVVGDQLFFMTFHLPLDRQLWVSDGTEGGTRAVTSWSTEEHPSYVPISEGPGGLAYLASDSLWRSDGTEAGTYSLGGEAVENLFYSGDALFFSAHKDGHGTELWISDGTVAGTQMLVDLNDSISSSDPHGFVQLGDMVYFLAEAPGYASINIWRTDGTPEGTELFFEDGSDLSNLVVADDKFFFNQDDSLYVSDGTSTATEISSSFEMRPPLPWRSTVATLGNKLVAINRSGFQGDEVWVSDGTPEGTFLLANLNSESNFLGAAGGYVFINSRGKLWKTDGTIAGTGIIADLFYLGRATTVMDGDQEIILFTAGQEDEPYGLWRSDGTAEGTFPVEQQVFDGERFRQTKGIATLNNAAYLEGFDPIFGAELYRFAVDGPNAVPSVDVFAPEVVVRGVEQTITLTAIDSPPDVAAGFTWNIDWDLDGVADETLTGAAEVSVTHRFAELDSPTFQAWAVDVDGGESEKVSATVAIASRALLPDAEDPTVANLVYGGTPGIDAVFFVPAGADRVLVFTQFEDSTLVNEYEVVHGVTGRIIAYGGGDLGDTIIGEFLIHNIEVHGGAGNDVFVGGRGSDSLFGGGGHDILLGGTYFSDGDDLLAGGDGRDLLFGHLGADSLLGDDGEDLLIAGGLEFSNLPTAIFAIQAEWLSERSYADRVANLTNSTSGARLNGSTFLIPGVTVFDDGSSDTLLGGGALDWYLYHFFDDLLSDEESDEEASNLSGY